jgi:hypothetical protein
MAVLITVIRQLVVGLRFRAEEAVLQQGSSAEADLQDTVLCTACSTF